MKQEIISTGKTVAAAVESAARQLGCDPEEVKYEVIAEAKKGFLGIGEAPAKVRVFVKKTPSEIANDFVKTLLADMSIDATFDITDTEEGDKLIRIDGEDASVLIGHHGDTLDCLQYLVNLAANKKENEADDREYTRFTVDIGDYRKRREATLRTLARKMAGKVQKYGRSITLEPMSAYERRIIHAEIQLIDGVKTNSVGQESNRRVVISREDGNKG